MNARNAAQVWDLPTSAEMQEADALAAGLDLPLTAAQVLVRRGLGDPDLAGAFLSVGQDDLHDPLLLAECGDAARRILQAIDGEERIVVHGDYDADGICGTALLTRGLRRLGANVQPFVPDRERDGYGVSMRLVEHAAERGVALLITVDTGSTALELARAADLGLDVIVCDHHRFDERPAGVKWFLNPLRADGGYPHEGLCGAGVAQKLLEAAYRLAGRAERPQLDLAAIATAADQVPLNRENRAIVRLGLKAIEETQEAGLKALVDVCRIDGHALDSRDILFQIAPRINAAGRVGSARVALDLLLAPGRAEAQRLASELDALNVQRREIGDQVTTEALAAARAKVDAEDPAALVLWSESWHRGLVGVSAAKVVEAFGRPAMLFACEGQLAVGSARSIPGVDLKEALDECAAHMQRYGGHAAAAGATLRCDRLEALATDLAAAVSRQDVDPRPRVHFVDALLQPGELDPRLAGFLYSLGPFGMGNRAPVFAATSVRQSGPARPIKDTHLRLAVRNGQDELSVIGFGRYRSWMPVVASAGHLDVSFELRHRPGSRWSEWEIVGDEIRDSGKGAG